VAKKIKEANICFFLYFFIDLSLCRRDFRIFLDFKDIRHGGMPGSLPTTHSADRTAPLAIILIIFKYVDHHNRYKNFPAGALNFLRWKKDRDFYGILGANNSYI